MLPAFIVSVGLIYYSVVYSGYLSFFDWGGGRQIMHPVGFDNYVEAFTDPVFWTAIRNTVIYFAEDVRDALHGRLVEALAPEGHLVVGTAERVADPQELGLTSPHPHIYCRA